MIAIEDLLNMVCTEAFEGNNGDTCRDYGHADPAVRECVYFGMDWAYGAYERTHSLKAMARWQRRLDWTSNVRRKKRRRELAQRKAGAK